MKLFISYARVDKPLCKQIVGYLDNAHEVWYDLRLHAGQDWWNEIQERLDWSEGFVYLLSPESAASEYCQKEFTIAAQSGKHIFPVLIQARTAIPDSLSHIHYADLSQGMEDIVTLLDAIVITERRQHKQAKPEVTAKPTKPAQVIPKEVKPGIAISQAADAMEDENFDNAVFILKQAIEQKPTGRVKRILQTMLEEADTALDRQSYLREAQREYDPILELVKRNATRAIGCEELEDYFEHYPDYDPENLKDLCAEVQTILSNTATISSVSSILPPPFDWINIPAGKVTLQEDYYDGSYIKLGQQQIFEMPAFAIAKYPVTNQQYAEYVKETGKKPQYWDNKDFNQPLQPVVGVSWFDVIEFCKWLSEKTGEEITLLTEQQWQRAAQDDDGREYTWGNGWDGSCCNNNVDKKGIGKTSLVTAYEGKQKNPYGVVDMAGNVWEWCLTAWETGSQNKSETNVRRVLRGGSWYNFSSSNFRASERDGEFPRARSFIRGFRLSRHYTTS